MSEALESSNLGNENNANLPVNLPANLAANTPAESGANAEANAASGLAETRPERRRRRRALISTPIRVRSVDVTCDGPDDVTTTLDVSRNGVLFVTSLSSFTAGMDVAVTFPYSQTPQMPQAEQAGRVMRISDLPGGRKSIAVALGLGVGEDIVDAAGRTLVAREETQPKVQPQQSDPKKPLVLVVDADPAIRQSLKTYLVGEGYEVFAVETASDAREVLKMFTPALLIAEIEGEELPGYDLCAHCKSTPRLKATPVMLLTRSAYPSDYSNAHSLGAVVCMAKPYRQERLGHVVRLLAPTPRAKAEAPVRTPDPNRRVGAPKRRFF
jgi:CheY-like chemotaxis protein